MGIELEINPISLQIDTGTGDSEIVISGVPSIAVTEGSIDNTIPPTPILVHHAAEHKFNGDDALFPIDTVELQPQNSPPAYAKGRVWYDNANRTISFWRAADSSGQINQETTIPFFNPSFTDTLLNGTPVYINGENADGTAIASVAKASDMRTGRTIAILTNDIPPRQIGDGTAFGIVHGMDTSALSLDPEMNIAYLAPDGGVTNIRPVYPNCVIILGQALSVDVNGDFFVAIASETFQKAFDIMKQPLGFPNRVQSILAYNSTTRAISLAPATTFWSFFNAGIEYRVETSHTVQHDNASGTYYWYINENNEFILSTMPWNVVKDIPIALVVFNAVTQEGMLADERHGTSRNPEWHRGQHNNVGTYFVSGLAAVGYTSQNSSDSNNQYGIEHGLVRDEDLDHAIAGQVDGGIYNILYRSGIAGEWSRVDSPLPYLSAPGSYIQYNQWTGTTWQLTTMLSGDYVNYYVLAIPMMKSDRTIFIVPGQISHNSLSAAQAAALNQDLQFGNFPFREFCLIHRFTMRTGISYTATGRCRIEAYADLRGSTTRAQILNMNVSISHNALSGLNIGDYIHLTAQEYTEFIQMKSVVLGG